MSLPCSGSWRAGRPAKTSHDARQHWCASRRSPPACIRPSRRRIQASARYERPSSTRNRAWARHHRISGQRNQDSAARQCPDLPQLWTPRARNRASARGAWPEMRHACPNARHGLRNAPGRRQPVPPKSPPRRPKCPTLRRHWTLARGGNQNTRGRSPNARTAVQKQGDDAPPAVNSCRKTRWQRLPGGKNRSIQRHQQGRLVRWTSSCPQTSAPGRSVP